MLVSSRLHVLALATSLVGCNAILGLEPPERGTGGAGGQVGETTGTTTSTVASSASSTGGAGGGEPQPCTPDCGEGCFEDVCGGQKPVQAAPNENLSCVLVASGAVFCSGSNRFGGLGVPVDDAPDTCTTSIVNGTTTRCSFAMRRVPLPAPARQIATGRHAVCAVLRDSRLFCWGSNENGQLGVEDAFVPDVCDAVPCATSPIEVTSMGPISHVAMNSFYHACAVAVGGDLWCWGRNTNGQIGSGVEPTTPGTIVLPFNVSASQGLVLPVATVALSHGTTCFNTVDGNLSCMGANADLAFGEPAADVLAPLAMKEMVVDAQVFAQSRSTRCMAVRDGNVFSCAGGNALGHYADPSDASPHVKMDARAGFEGVSVVGTGAGDFHFCAIDDAGIVRCWGGTFLGQTGNGTIGQIDGPFACALAGMAGALPCLSTPQPVDFGGKTARKLFVGNEVTMAILDDDTVVAWGMNQGGQLAHPPGTMDDSDMCHYSNGLRLVCNALPRPVVGLPTGDGS